MQDLINNFGINGFLLAAQIVNFLIILYLLKRFAFGPILKLLQERKAKIAESLKNAEETEKLLAETEEKEKEILKKAQAQAQEFLTDAKKQASEIHEAAEASAKVTVEKMIADANKKISLSTDEAEKELEKKITTIAIGILEKSLKGMLDEKDQQKVVERAMKDLH